MPALFMGKYSHWLTLQKFTYGSAVKIELLGRVASPATSHFLCFAMGISSSSVNIFLTSNCNYYYFSYIYKSFSWPVVGLLQGTFLVKKLNVFLVVFLHSDYLLLYHQTVQHEVAAMLLGWSLLAVDGFVGLHQNLIYILRCSSMCYDRFC